MQRIQRIHPFTQGKKVQLNFNLHLTLGYYQSKQGKWQRSRLIHAKLVLVQIKLTQHCSTLSTIQIASSDPLNTSCLSDCSTAVKRHHGLGNSYT